MTQDEKLELRQVLSNRFSLDNLKELAYDLGYPDAEGQSKSGLARRLIDYCDENNKDDELLSWLRNNRPDIDMLPEEELGFFDLTDALVLQDFSDKTTASFKASLASMRKIEQMTSDLSDKMNALAANISSLKLGVESRSLSAEIVLNGLHQGIKDITADMEAYSKDLELELPEFRKAWGTLERRMSNAIELWAVIGNSNGELRQSMRDLTQAISTFRDKFDRDAILLRSTRNSLDQLERLGKRLSSPFRKAVRETDRSVRSTISEYDLVKAKMTKLHNSLIEYFGSD